MISLTSLFNGPWFSFSTHSGNDNCENEQNSAFHYFLSALLIPWLTTPTNQYKFTHSLDLIFFFHGKTLWRSWIIVLISTILYGVLEINYHLNTYLFKPQLNFCETFCSMTVCLFDLLCSLFFQIYSCWSDHQRLDHQKPRDLISSAIFEDWKVLSNQNHVLLIVFQLNTHWIKVQTKF